MPKMVLPLFSLVISSNGQVTPFFFARIKKKKTPTKKRKSTKKSGSKPTNTALYAKVKAEAKRKFDVYPSAYANAWLVRTYKKRGGGYRSA